MLSSPVNLGKEIVSLSTPEMTKIACSGSSISVSNNGLEINAVVSIPKFDTSSLNPFKSFQSSP